MMKEQLKEKTKESLASVLPDHRHRLSAERDGRPDGNRDPAAVS